MAIFLLETPPVPGSCLPMPQSHCFLFPFRSVTQPYPIEMGSSLGYWYKFNNPDFGIRPFLASSAEAAKSAKYCQALPVTADFIRKDLHKDSFEKPFGLFRWEHEVERRSCATATQRQECLLLVSSCSSNSHRRFPCKSCWELCFQLL